MGHVNVNISLLFCCLTTGAEKYARKKRLIVNSAVSKYDINECREERRKQNRCKLNRKPAVFSCNEKDKAKLSPSNTNSSLLVINWSIFHSSWSAFYFPGDLICEQWLKLIIMLTTSDAPGNVWFLLLKLSDSRGKAKNSYYLRTPGYCCSSQN